MVKVTANRYYGDNRNNSQTNEAHQDVFEENLVNYESDHQRGNDLPLLVQSENDFDDNAITDTNEDSGFFNDGSSSLLSSTAFIYLFILFFLRRKTTTT